MISIPILTGATGPAINTGPHLENLVFDPTVYGLTCLIVVLALYSVLVALRAGVRFPGEGQRRMATGTGLIGLGFAMIIVTAISLLVLFRASMVGGYLYLQTEFTIVYLGCALVFLGVDRTWFAFRGQAASDSGARMRGRVVARLVLWVAFFVSAGVALAYLFDTATYPVTTVGGIEHVGQEGVFWLPPFVTLIVGVIGSSVFALGRKEKATRVPAVWLALFFGLEISGILRESSLIPSVGDPFADMLLAFGPFTVGSFCLAMCGHRLRSQLSAPLDKML